MGKVVMYSSVSVDGFVADENDQPGPLFDWLSSGDVPLDETGELKVSQTSYDYTRPHWDQIGATIVGRQSDTNIKIIYVLRFQGLAALFALSR